MPRKLRNGDLRAELLPSEDDDEGTCRFAHTFDGYTEMGGFDECSSFAEAARVRFDGSRTVPLHLKELRACLFYEYRRWRQASGPPGPPELEYRRALLRAIREKVEASRTGKKAASS